MTTSRERWEAVRRIQLGHARKLLHHRYGPRLPDDDAGREDLRILLNLKARCYYPQRRMQALLREIELTAPWMTGAEAEKLAAEIAADPLTFKSDALGRELNLDWRTRERLRVWQIGAVDMDAEARKERRKLRHRERMQRTRKAKGAKPRAEYEGKSLSATRPWEAEGISRAKWYRQRRRDPMRQVRAQANGHA